MEPVLIRKKFLKWQDAHPEFPRIVFHGLRHSSATYQLMISGGDVKAVQGTTGHATADMLVNTYAHIQQSSRVELGKKFEEGFYAKSESPPIIMADEPTGALDSRATDALLDVFQQINQTGQTLLMVTHSLKAASRAGRILFIRDGQVYHQLYRGEMTNEQFYEKISDALTVMTRKDAMDGEMA